MINVHIELSAQLKSKAANAPCMFQLKPPWSLQDGIRMFADECGDEFSKFVFNQSGNLRPTMMLSVNDMQMFWDDHYLLSDSDRICIVSPAAGGSSG